ncbi:hypothetical protein ACJX0J_015010, partial [Zea mays]
LVLYSTLLFISTCCEHLFLLILVLRFLTLSFMQITCLFCGAVFDATKLNVQFVYWGINFEIFFPTILHFWIKGSIAAIYLLVECRALLKRRALAWKTKEGYGFEQRVLMYLVSLWLSAISNVLNSNHIHVLKRYGQTTKTIIFETMILKFMCGVCDLPILLVVAVAASSGSGIMPSAKQLLSLRERIIGLKELEG